MIFAGFELTMSYILSIATLHLISKYKGGIF